MYRKTCISSCTRTLSASLIFHKDLSLIWLCKLSVRGNIELDSTGKERGKMTNFKFVNSDVDDMIFDVNDYYISEK